MIKFISYSGRYPSLCMGTLLIEIDGKEYSISDALCSGGSVWFDNGWEEHVEHGPWSFDSYSFPEELEQFRDEITDLVNESIPHGCCGGCI